MSEECGSTAAELVYISLLEPYPFTSPKGMLQEIVANKIKDKMISRRDTDS